MNSPHELQQAMRELANLPTPPGLADQALTGAKGLHRRRSVLTGLAAVAVIGALAVPFMIRGTASADISGYAAPSGSPKGCTSVPNVDPTTKEVAPQDWPAFVTTAIGLLPQRDDYVVQNANDLCSPGSTAAANASTVISIGRLREHGYLTVRLYSSGDLQFVPVSCTGLGPATAAQIKDPPNDVVLFCQEATEGKPMVYGTTSGDSITVGAVYPDHRAVLMERGGPNAASEITVEVLRSVVANPVLGELIPVLDGPVPTRSVGSA